MTTELRWRTVEVMCEVIEFVDRIGCSCPHLSSNANQLASLVRQGFLSKIGAGQDADYKPTAAGRAAFGNWQDRQWRMLKAALRCRDDDHAPMVMFRLNEGCVRVFHWGGRRRKWVEGLPHPTIVMHPSAWKDISEPMGE